MPGFNAKLGFGGLIFSWMLLLLDRRFYLNLKQHVYIVCCVSSTCSAVSQEFD